MTSPLYLFMVLIGCKPPGRHTEQHDVFFGISDSLQNLVPQLKVFWPAAAEQLHVDAYRLLTHIDGYSITVLPKNEEAVKNEQLYFINLGGYKPGEMEEFHYKLVVVAKDKGTAIQKAKQTAFYKHTGFTGAGSHIDDMYGVDVDDIYAVEDILPLALKEQYSIWIEPATTVEEDVLHLGYFKLSKIEKGDFVSE